MNTKSLLDGWGVVVAYRWAELVNFYPGGGRLPDFRLLDLVRDWRQTDVLPIWPDKMAGGVGRGDPRYLGSIQAAYVSVDMILSKADGDTNKVCAWIYAGKAVRADVVTDSKPVAGKYVEVSRVSGETTIEELVALELPRARPFFVRRRINAYTETLRKLHGMVANSCDIVEP